MKLEFWVDLEDASGNKLGDGPLTALSWRQKKLLSASGEYATDLVAADPNISALVEKKNIVCRYRDTGGTVRVFGRGIVDNIKAQALAGGVVARPVSGNDQLRELTYRGVGQLLFRGVDNAGVTNAPTLAMAFAPAGWTLTDGTLVTAVYGGMDDDSVLATLCRAGQVTGEHFRLGGDREVVWLGPASSFEDSGVTAFPATHNPTAAATDATVAIITSFEEEIDASEVITRIRPRGSGNGKAVTTLSNASASAPAGYTLDTVNNWLINTAAEAAYGRIERALDYKEIGPLSNTDDDLQSASNALMTAAFWDLERHKQPAKFYRVGLATSALLEPGTMIRVVYREVGTDGSVYYDIDDDFIILSVDQAIDANGIYTTGIEISTTDRMPSSDEDVLAGQMQSGKIYAAHQQLSASVDNISWRDELDADNAASCCFWLGDEYTSIQQAIFRFRIAPLRSTVKSVGGTSTTTGSGGGGTQTSASGGGQTASGGGHGHNTDMPGAAQNFTAMGWREDSGFVYPVSTDLVDGRKLETGTQLNHEHSIAAHTHDVTFPTHTHSVTASIEMQYGIFEESPSNTLALADLILKMNGGSDLAGDVDNIGNGWYALDLTDALTNAQLRPSQENNALEISTLTADKTARIEAHLVIRGVVQAVNYT